MEIDKTLYADHLVQLGQRWQRALISCRFDSVAILAGSAQGYFLDDQSAPFRPNPHFAQWFPQTDCAGSALLFEPGRRPVLLFFSPEDYWHQPAALPDWAGEFEVETFSSEAELDDRIATHLQRLPDSAVIGPQARAGNFAGSVNPQNLLAHVHWSRAWKTGFELAAMREASRRAALGHNAAAECFHGGGSEFEIHLSYLGAAGQTPEELPYASIIALNEHAGVLHYQHYQRNRPAATHSFLIDAGASAAGYAADVTRTYAADPRGDFAGLIDTLEQAQLELISSIRPGQRYPDLHAGMHLAVGRILAEQGLINCSAESALDTGLTRAFLPHGLGHLIGLQTHDVGGQQRNEAGEMELPPEQYPALRLTREVSVDMVFTVEPGIYFIPMLLKELKARSAGAAVDWRKVELLSRCGGIRIEDNVRVTEAAPENLTRDAFAAVSETNAS